MNHIGNLPDRPILAILNRLSFRERIKCRRLSKRFNNVIIKNVTAIDLATNSVHWANKGRRGRRGIRRYVLSKLAKLLKDVIATVVIWTMNVFGASKVRLTETVAERKILRHLGANVVKLRWIDAATPDQARLIGQHCPKLSELILGRKAVQCGDSFWRELIGNRSVPGHVSRLTQFHTSFAALNKLSVPVFDAKYLKYFSGLQYLDAHLVSNDVAAGFSQVLTPDTLNVLQSLHTVSSAQPQFAVAIAAANGSFPSLQYFQLVHRKFKPATSQFRSRNVCLACVVKWFPKLKSLSLSNVLISLLANHRPKGCLHGCFTTVSHSPKIVGTSLKTQSDRSLENGHISTVKEENITPSGSMVYAGDSPANFDDPPAVPAADHRIFSILSNISSTLKALVLDSCYVMDVVEESSDSSGTFTSQLANDASALNCATRDHKIPIIVKLKPHFHAKSSTEACLQNKSSLDNLISFSYVVAPESSHPDLLSTIIEDFSFLRNCSKLLNLQIVNCPQFTYRIFETYVPTKLPLQTLNLNGSAAVCDELLVNLADIKEYHTTLETLCLDCPFDSEGVSMDRLTYFLESEYGDRASTRLTRLSLSGHHRLNDDIWSLLATDGQCLHELNVSGSTLSVGAFVNEFLCKRRDLVMLFAATIPQMYLQVSDFNWDAVLDEWLTLLYLAKVDVDDTLEPGHKFIFPARSNGF